MFAKYQSREIDTPDPLLETLYQNSPSALFGLSHTEREVRVKCVPGPPDADRGVHQVIGSKLPINVLPESRNPKARFDSVA